MFYGVIEELIPESQSGHHTNIATIGFAMGFVLMMILLLTVGFVGCVLLALCALAIHEGPDLIWKVRKYVHMRRNTITLKKGQYRIED